MKRAISAIAMVVPDYDEALRFYVSKAGFTCVEDTDFGNGKRWVRIAPRPDAETAILLARADGPDQAAAIGNQTGGRVGFFLETDDFTRDYDAMTRNGVTFLETPRHEPYGTVAVWRDPFGNRWDLIQRR